MTVPARTENVAQIALAGTLTEGGMVNRDGVLPERVTTVLLVVEFDRVIVQVVSELEARLVTAHCSEDKGCAFATVTETLPLVPVIAAALTATADRVCVPFGVARVLHERLYKGPAPVTAAPRFAPSSLT